MYEDEEAIHRSEAIPDWSFPFENTSFRVLDQSPSDPNAVKIEFFGHERWIYL